jgi:olefin beta-lactone synthetase
VNAIELFKINAEKTPQRMAIADITHGELTFSELLSLSARAQQFILKNNIGPHDSVLMAIPPSPGMYAMISALLGLGIRIIFIEPWLSPERINEIIQYVNPKAFISGKLGKLWGLRSEAIRNIPLWLDLKDLKTITDVRPFEVRDLAPDHHAFIVFSSGTTGLPKGIVRTHEYLQEIYNIFTKSEPEDFPYPDLAVFPNIALFHLATGRGAIVVPANWKRKNLQRVMKLCEKYHPVTISTGPAFLKKIFDENFQSYLTGMKRIVIGGALTDCWLMEKTLNQFPSTRVLHIYGSSEAEPIAYTTAQEALNRSKEKGFFQVLFLGHPMAEINFKIKDEVLWVSGRNVSGEYIGDQTQNQGIKERDESGALWHCMGDRVQVEDEQFWFQGRENQKREDFILEQHIYAYLQSSACFIYRNPQDEIILLGQEIAHRSQEIKEKFPAVSHIENTIIRRDRRHRSRIDRLKSLPQKYRRSSMNQFSKWLTYLKERSPLPALLTLSAIIAISSMSFRSEFEPLLFLAGVIFTTLIFIQLRLGDEVKDFEKDKIVNPTRPLPRGLLRPAEVRQAMHLVVILLLIASLALALFYDPPGGILLSSAAVFGWLMYHEFFIGEKLNQFPILYALSHQIIVFAIFGWIGLSLDSSLMHERMFQGWVLANFGASFCFEITRKLNPHAHEMAQTYPQHYGRVKTALFAYCCIVIIAVGSLMAGFGPWMLLPLALLTLVLTKWIKTPEKYKQVEGINALCGLIVALAPALQWLIRSWR